MKGYIAYMDILGFTSKRTSSAFKIKYDNLKNYIGEKFSRDPKATIYVVSDSIIVCSENFEPAKNYARMIYTWGMRNDFWIRGAIAQGHVEEIDSEKIVGENKNVILPYFGEAYLTAYKLESKLNMAGIVIDDNLKPDNPDLPLEEEYTDGYMEYQEYLPKDGNEGKKRLLLPDYNFEQSIADTMYFEEMLKSHLEDIDKYVNTFSFYLKLLLKSDNLADIHSLLENLCKQLGLQGRRILIPPKVIIVFVAVIRGLFDLYRSPENKYLSKGTLELEVSTILDALKKQGYLPIFTDFVLEYDNVLYSEIYQLRADIANFK